LFRRVLKHAALAVAVLLPTVVGIAAAPPAFAGGAYQVAWPTNSGKMLGETEFDIFHDESNDPDCLGTWDSYYAVTVTPGLDPSTQFYGTQDYHFAPGEAVTMHFAWMIGAGGGFTPGKCTNSLATSATVTLKDMSGTQIGSAWIVNISADPGFTKSGNITSPTMYFDSTGFGAGGGTPKIGQFYVGVTLSGGCPCPNGNNENGASTEGGTPGPLHDSTYDGVTSYWTKGLFSTGYMGGMLASNDSDYTKFTNLEPTAGKNFPVSRLYNTGFGVPCSVDPCPQADPGNTKKYIDNGRLAIYDVMPPTSGLGSNCPKVGGGTQTCTPWADIAQGNQDTTIRAILSDLDTWSKDPGAYGEAIFALTHEPKQYASDIVSCGTSCYGTSQDYRSAYAHIMSILGSGDMNYPHVRLAYIEVDTNAIVKASASGHTGPIGSGDLMYAGNDYTDAVIRPTALPCSLAGITPPVACTSSNVDLLAHDTYNFYAYLSHPWRTFTYKLTDANGGMVTLAKQWKKHILFAELGSHPGCRGSVDNGKDYCTGETTTQIRDSWFTDGNTTMTQNADVEHWLLGFVYYHVAHTYSWAFLGKTTTPDIYGDWTVGCTPPNCTGGWHAMVKNNSWFVPDPTFG
jgi:hypothetical protein